MLSISHKVFCGKENTMTANESLQNGSVRKKGNQWYYRFRVQESDGSWKQREFKGGKTKKETELMLKQALNDYKYEGELFDPGSLTVAELCDQWWESEVENSDMASNSRTGLQAAIKHIKKEELGSRKLRDLTIEDIQAYVDLKSYGKFDERGNRTVRAYAESTLRKHFSVLNGMFKYAVYPKRYLRENPMQYVKKRRQQKVVKIFGDSEENKVSTITHGEFEKAVEFFLKNEHLSYYALPVQIAYYTGLRAGEVCGLNWEDIDFERARLTVRRSMYYDKEEKCWELKVPKNGKPRVVDFGESLLEILKQAKKEQLERQSRYGQYYHQHFMQPREIRGRVHWQIFTKAYADDGVLSSRVTKGKFIEEANMKEPLQPLFFVCSKQDGELLTTQSLKYCNKVLQKEVCGLEHFHFHALRHTYASTLVNHGANLKDVQMLLGHSDIKITLNTYSHVDDESRRKAVDIFEKAVIG